MKRLLLLLLLALTYPAFGAAVLTISACSTDVTGTVWTCAVSGGGVGSLTPTTAITKFVPHLTLSAVGSQIATSTVTASGTGASGTVVVTAAMPVQSGETATLDWTTGGNLTDGTNTASGQNGVAVTNNSTITGTTLGTASANVYSLGRWITFTCSSYGNRTCSYTKGYYSALEFKLTVSVSTDVALDLSDSQTTYFSVDGGGETSVSTASSTTQKWTWTHGVTLGAGSHDVKVYNHSAITYLLTATAIRISSASGATCCTDIPDYDGTAYLVGSSSYFRSESGLTCTDATQNYTGCLSENGAAFALWSVRWYGTGFSTINAWLYNASGVYKVYMDGVYQASYTSPGGTKWSVGTLASGLDTGFHLWEIVSTGSAGYLYSVMAPVGAVVGPATPPIRPYIATHGDSIVAGIHCSGYSTDHSCIGFFAYPTVLTSFMTAGTPSQTISACANGCGGTSYYLRDHTSQVVTNTKPIIVVEEGGINDEIYACPATCTANAPAGFITDYTTTLTNLAGNMQAGGIIIALGVLPYGGSTNNASTIANWRAAINSAVVAYNASKTNGVTAFFVNPTGWMNVNTTDLFPDLLHPIDAGYAKIRTQMIPIMQAAVMSRSTAWF